MPRSPKPGTQVSFIHVTWCQIMNSRMVGGKWQVQSRTLYEWHLVWRGFKERWYLTLNFGPKWDSFAFTVRNCTKYNHPFYLLPLARIFYPRRGWPLMCVETHRKVIQINGRDYIPSRLTYLEVIRKLHNGMNFFPTKLCGYVKLNHLYFGYEAGRGINRVWCCLKDLIETRKCHL